MIFFNLQGCCQINTSFSVGKNPQHTKYCLVNLIITKNCIEPHTASLLKGASRVTDFSQGEKHIFRKLFLQVVPLTYLTFLYTE